MIKVLVAEFTPLLREGLRLILSRAGDLTVDAGAATTIQLLQKLHEASWDVLLLGIEGVEQRGHLDVVHEVKRCRPRLPILAMLPEPEAVYGPRALEAGVSGCLERGCTPEDVVEGIRKLAGGWMYISPSLAQILARRAVHPLDHKTHDGLSEREFEVFVGLARGETLSSIARKLSLSTKTVSTYRTRILEKMEFHSNAQITQYALKHDLICGTELVCASKPVGSATEANSHNSVSASVHHGA